MSARAMHQSEPENFTPNSKPMDPFLNQMMSILIEVFFGCKAGKLKFEQNT